MPDEKSDIEIDDDVGLVIGVIDKTPPGKCSHRGGAGAVGPDGNPSWFQPGNNFWEARTTIGREKIFTTPDVLWFACTEYFVWCVCNPLLEHRLFSQKEGPPADGDLRKVRAFTISGLCMFLDIDRTTWLDYRVNSVFSTICKKVEEAIREQKFTAAAADLLNPAIIARDLGMVDKKQITGTVNTNVKTITEDMSANEAADVWLEILRSEDIPQEQVEDQSDSLNPRGPRGDLDV